jgi:hypothetical protein
VREKDRQAVRLIPGVLATYAGFAIVRRPVPAGVAPVPVLPARVDPTRLAEGV